MPSIFTFADVPPVTSPPHFGLLWNLIVPGSCMWELSLCLALLPFTAHPLPPIFTSSERAPLIFPMNGCGRGTVAVPEPEGTTIMCVSNPMTWSSWTAICFPSAHTPLLPESLMFLPLSVASPSASMVDLPPALTSELSSVSMLIDLDLRKVSPPQSIASLRHLIPMPPSSLTRVIPPSLPMTALIWPSALSMRTSPLPSLSVISILWFFVCTSMLPLAFPPVASGGLCWPSYMNPST